MQGTSPSPVRWPWPEEPITYYQKRNALRVVPFSHLGDVRGLRSAVEVNLCSFGQSGMNTLWPSDPECTHTYGIRPVRDTFKYTETWERLEY